MKNHIVFAKFCSTGVGKILLVAISLAFCTLGLGASARAQQLRFTTINVGAAGTSAGQGTFAQSINVQGEIAGYYVDENFVFHGFVRTNRGEITTFDPPGSVFTLAFGSNPQGAIAGFYFDSNDSVFHAFVRTIRGDITTFEAPDAAATFAAQINPAGAIAGDYRDANNVSHGYLRAPNGNITPFDAPGAGTGAGQGTMTGFVDCINPEGAMTGYVGDASNVFHGYLRAPNGNITPFDAPGAGTGAGLGTFPAGINLFGTTEGSYLDASNVSHGFVRAPLGTIYTFDAPGADTIDSGYGTFPATLNDFGIITGNYLDASGVNHGFLRSPDGKFTTFDAPGADLTPGDFNGTFPTDINLFGVITGFYIDSKGITHGFVAVPCDQWCSASDEAATPSNRASPATTTKPVDPPSPSMLNPKLRLFPWYRSFGVQPTK